jgi:hypothetical protein
MEIIDYITENQIVIVLLTILIVMVLSFNIDVLYIERYSKQISFYNDKRIKEVFGTYLYYQLIMNDEKLAPKITGMLIELDNYELLSLVNNAELLKEKYEEAVKILHNNSD